MSLSASNGMQRTVGLVMSGMSIGIAYCTIVIPPRTANAKIRSWVKLARYLAVITSMMTTFVGFHMTHLSFASALGDYRLIISEMGGFLVATLMFHQAFFAVMAYLLILRIRSINVWASSQPRFVPVTLSLALTLIAFPALMMLIAIGQGPEITRFLGNFFYNRMFKTSLAIQSTLIGTASVVTDLAILSKIAASRAALAQNDLHTRARLKRQMIVVTVNAAVTLIEVSVRVAATQAAYVAVDTYIKGLNISVDIFTYCTIGVTVSDVLRAPLQSDNDTNGSNQGESTLAKQGLMLSTVTGGKQIVSAPSQRALDVGKSSTVLNNV